MEKAPFGFIQMGLSFFGCGLRRRVVFDLASFFNNFITACLGLVATRTNIIPAFYFAFPIAPLVLANVEEMAANHFLIDAYRCSKDRLFYHFFLLCFIYFFDELRRTFRLNDFSIYYWKGQSKNHPA